MSTQTTLLTLKTKLDSILSGVDTPFRRNPSSTSVRSMSPSDVLSNSPPATSSPPRPVSESASTPSTVTTALNFNKSPLPASPDLGVSALTLSTDKKDEVSSAREKGSFEQTRGNWGNRIVLTTYPGQANVGSNPLQIHMR
jgi:hypothetical protein